MTTYDAALRQRGSVTVWITVKVVEGWRASPCAAPGGQPWHSPTAILAGLALQALFRLALRRTEGLIGSMIGLFGLAPRVPGHPTLSRRAKTLAVPRPRCGAGAWLLEKHGANICRSWSDLPRCRPRAQPHAGAWTPSCVGVA